MHCTNAVFRLSLNPSGKLLIVSLKVIISVQGLTIFRILVNSSTHQLFLKTKHFRCYSAAKQVHWVSNLCIILYFSILKLWAERMMGSVVLLHKPVTSAKLVVFSGMFLLFTIITLNCVQTKLHRPT